MGTKRVRRRFQVDEMRTKRALRAASVSWRIPCARRRRSLVPRSCSRSGLARQILPQLAPNPPLPSLQSVRPLPFLPDLPPPCPSPRSAASLPFSQIRRRPTVLAGPTSSPTPPRHGAPTAATPRRLVLQHVPPRERGPPAQRRPVEARQRRPVEEKRRRPSSSGVRSSYGVRSSSAVRSTSAGGSFSGSASPTIVRSMVAWICSFSCGARNFFSTWKPLHKSMVNILCLTKL